MSLIDSRKSMKLFGESGRRFAAEVPFDNTLASLSARYTSAAAANTLLSGSRENFNFGYHGQGNITTLKHFAAKFNFSSDCTPVGK